MSNIGDTGGRQNTDSAFLTWVRSHGTAIAVVFGIVAILVASVAFYAPHEFSAAKPDDQVSYTPQTEAVFVAQQDNLSSDVMAEWREVRGDHKILAYAIAYCKPLRAIIGNVDTMPRNVFSALLLDLTPTGDHKFVLPTLTSVAAKPAASAPQTASVDDGSAAQAVRGSPVLVSTKNAFDLSNYQQSMLSLSDAIGRARLSAASEASGNYPKMTTFGWVTIGISAIATLLVTIKASMSPPAPEARRMTYVFIGVGLLAMTLSALGTALTSAKQFYDPTRAYRMSKAALSELQRLHKQVALDFASSLNPDTCGPVEGADTVKLRRVWAARLADLQAGVLMASSNLQGSDIAQLRAEITNRSNIDDAGGAAPSGKPEAEVNSASKQ